MFSYKKGLKIIQHYESCKLTAYRDGGGVWTVGYGTTTYPDGSPVKEGDTVTYDEAYNLLIHRCKKLSKVVKTLVYQPLTMPQIGALISFCYNCGIGAFEKSTLLKVINNNPKDYTEIRQQFGRWKYDNGEELNGLLFRRKSEADLYQFGKVKFYN